MSGLTELNLEVIIQSLNDTFQAGLKFSAN